jgi:hypothetical protein
VNNGLWFAPTATEDVATSTTCRPAATKAIELLRAHGVQLREVKAGNQRRGGVPHCRQHPAAAEQRHRHRRARPAHAGGSVGTALPTAPCRRQLRVAMNQPLARLAFYLLAPTSDDGVVAWN